MKFILPSVFAFGMFFAVSAEALPRVALMDFSVDDNSFRSAQEAANFASLVQIQLATEPGIEWVERAQIKRIREELNLSAAQGLGVNHSLRLGKLAKADWVITGQFSLDDRNRRTLFLEVTGPRDADVLASRTVVFPDASVAGAGVNPNQVDRAVAALRQILSEAASKDHERAGKTVVAPLFFADVSGGSARFGDTERFGNLNQSFSDLLEKNIAAETNIQLIHFPKAYRSLDESEMVMDGLVDADENSWRQTADLYVWGTYAASRKFVRGQPPQEELEITLHLWDGAASPLQITEKLPLTAPPDRVRAILEHFVKEVVAHARPAARTNSEPIRKGITQSILEAYDQMTLEHFGPGFREELKIRNPDLFLEATHLLETACFFDPDNAKARILYITCRWGNSSYQVKNEFWSNWRRSQAIGDYVARFGLEPVAVQLPFPYTNPDAIPQMYVSWQEEALNIFPGWRSPEDFKTEDEDQKHGVSTSLMGAERRGFPRQMPHDLAWEWREAADADLVLRKKIVADFKAAHASSTNGSRIIPSIVARKAPVTVNPHASANVAKPKGSFIPVTPSPSSSQPVVSPLWVRQFRPGFSMFRLLPPADFPEEVKPEFREIKFPKQFEVQSVFKMGFLDDKLLILAMDQRSAQSSDANAETSAEVLDRRNRLWTLDPGGNTPVLYRPELFPQSVASYFVADGRLWFAGNTTGYLDLKTGEVRKFGLADDFTIHSSVALGSAGGKIFVAGDLFRMCSADPALGKWSNVELPHQRVASSDTHSVIVSCGEWLGFASGAPLVFDAARNVWTRIPEVVWALDAAADEKGFWFSDRSGLCFYEITNQTAKTWHRPGMIQGMTSMNLGGYYNGNPTMWQKDVDQMDAHIQAFMLRLEKERAKIHVEKEKEKVIDPLNLNSRMPGEVTAVAEDGEFLWFGAETYFGNYLMLLHKPSGLLVACYHMPPRGHIASIAVSNASVWVGTAYGDQQLFEFSKAPFLSVPRYQWVSLTISPEERARIVGNMSTRDQALYAFYSADDKRVAELLENISPAKATLEEMFLLAFSYDASGLDRPELAQSWFERIIARDPKAPWAKVAQQALSANLENHRTKSHAEALLKKYDRNHDGVLDEQETASMKKDPVYQRAERAFEEVNLDVQTKAIFERYDANKDGMLEEQELVTLANFVRLCSDAPPEMLQGRKLLEAPFLIKDFPQGPELLKKYDLSRDGTLNLDELKAVAKDIKRKR